MRFLVTGGTGFIGERVVRNLARRGIPVVAADWDLDDDAMRRLRAAVPEASDLVFQILDVCDFHGLVSILHKYPDISHIIHLAYLMGAECESNPLLGVRVNLLGMTHLFEAVLLRGLRRLVFTSSETVYGASQQVYGQRPVREEDYCAPSDHHFTYGVMKLCNEFIAQKYVRLHGLSVAWARPPIVFGHGRKRGAVLWAADFASLPAVGQRAILPFPAENRDSWIYVDDCAEQLVRLALKPQLSHLAYNNGGQTVSGKELAQMVRRWIPDASIEFDSTKPGTPLIDEMDGTRLQDEISFRPRPLLEGIRAHINEAREWAGMTLIE